MTLAERLRRYLHSFIGDAEQADAILARCLRHILAEGGAVSEVDAFHAVHREAARARCARGGADGEPLRLALDELPPMLRGAFLLTRLEEFAPAQAAAVLGVEEAALEQHARSAERMVKGILCPAGGTALICDDDVASAMALSAVAWELGFDIIRAPEPEPGLLRGQPAPFLIIAEAIDRTGRSRGPRVLRLANAVGAATLCVSASSRAGEFLRQVPHAHFLRKPHGRDSASRAILDAVAAHRASALRLAMLHRA